ncbi:MAG: ketoacyl-ACP synthase III [Chloroflexi bacterium]|nr:MAG: ketoacyl-ACP synthase III [Chloroflexota bacterium]
MVRTAVIQGIDHYLPEERLTNAELSALYPGWTADKILEKTGILERRIAADTECASDLAVRAADRLLERLDVDRSRIDLLVFCTQSPDHFLPTTACLIQERLGLGTNVAAFDYNLGCSAFPYGLAIVRGLIDAGIASTALLLMADTYSKFIHPLDKSVRTLFGDAVSAVLITAEERAAPSIGPFVLGTDGTGAGNLIVPAGAMRHPLATADLAEKTDKSDNTRTAANLFMNGPAIFEFTVKRVDDVDLVILHQASEMLLATLQGSLRIPDEKFVRHYSRCGNTVSSTIPIALQSVIDAGRVARGDVLLVAGFGVGYSWGANLIRWEPNA